MKPAWRVVTLILTLAGIYLLFPLLIVPSPLPAINEIGPSDAYIFQLEGERIMTLSDWLEFLAGRHRLGRQIIWNFLTQAPL